MHWVHTHTIHIIMTCVRVVNVSFATQHFNNRGWKGCITLIIIMHMYACMYRLNQTSTLSVCMWRVWPLDICAVWHCIFYVYICTYVCAYSTFIGAHTHTYIISNVPLVVFRHRTDRGNSHSSSPYTICMYISKYIHTTPHRR